ncbi:antibiotic biosynthesis monooxygenase family protein [Cellulomonas sp.]|uniref:antibiotic biosynthesis monooxygenase family protein n=1 Tax=Cellulomonas sp. TaxID=40001 RepID=UPI003BA8CEA7
MTAPLGAPVLEHALLPVRAGHEGSFERAMAEAVPLVAGIPGLRGIHVSRSVERPGTYLLLIGWDSVEAHETGFRGSPQYARWRELLHGFYDPFPVVEHFLPVPVQPTRG